MPKAKLSKTLIGMDDRIEKIFAYTTSVLSRCTTVSFEEFTNFISRSLEKGLTSKIFFGRPYPDLYRKILEDGKFLATEKAALAVPEEARVFVPREVVALETPEQSGIHYTKQKSLVGISNRYAKLLPVVTKVLPKLMLVPELKAYVDEMRAQGLKDWYIALIIFNAVFNKIVYTLHGQQLSDGNYQEISKDVSKKIFSGGLNAELENFSFAGISRKVLEETEMTTQAAIFKTWDLSIHTGAPDFSAMKEFLISRYKLLEDDVDHEPLFEL